MLENFIQLVSEETVISKQIEAEKQRIKEEKDKKFKIEANQSLEDFFAVISEASRVPRKKGQPAGSDKHSDLYTDENPKGTIHGLKFATVDDAKASVKKIINSGKTHAHKIQAAIAMEQRAKEMGKTAEAAVYRTYINKMKEKTKEMNKEGLEHYPGNISADKDKSDGWIVGDPPQPIEFDGSDTKSILDKANKEVEKERQYKQKPYIIEKHYIREVPVEKKIEMSEQDNAQRIDVLKTFVNKLDAFDKTLAEKTNIAAGHIYADKMTNHLPKKEEINEINNIRREFNHFREMVSRQMSTIGGGGAVNLLDLDDIDTSSLGNGKFLVFNSTSGKLEFTDQVDGN